MRFPSPPPSAPKKNHSRENLLGKKFNDHPYDTLVQRILFKCQKNQVRNFLPLLLLLEALLLWLEPLLLPELLLLLPLLLEPELELRLLLELPELELMKQIQWSMSEWSSLFRVQRKSVLTLALWASCSYNVLAQEPF